MTTLKTTAETTYEMTNGYVSTMGTTWKTVDAETANNAIDCVAKFENVDRDRVIELLSKNPGAGAKTGKQSPNYYCDHGMEKIR